MTKLNKKPEHIKYAIFLAIGLAFYFRAELIHLLHPPDPADKLFQSGAVACQRGDFKQAIQIADNLLTTYPNSGKVRHAHLLKGLVFQKEGNLDAAATEFHIVIEHYPGTEEARVAAIALKEIGVVAKGKPKLTEEPPDPNSLRNLRSPGAFIGTWRSQQTAVEKQGLCVLDLEVRVQEQGFSGFPSLRCHPISVNATKYRHSMMSGMQAMALMTNPTTAVLSGVWDKDYRTLVFHVERAVSINASGCAITGDFTVTPYGEKQVGADWRDSCSDHPQFMLSRLP